MRACNPSTGKAKVKDVEFESSLSCRARHCFKQQKVLHQLVFTLQFSFLPGKEVLTVCGIYTVLASLNCGIACGYNEHMEDTGSYSFFG